MARRTFKQKKLIIKKAAKAHHIRPKILYGLWGTESHYGDNTGPSSAGALGDFQFMPATAQSYGINPHKFKPAANAAAKYLSSYKSRGTAGMLSSYVAGPAGGIHMDYVNSVLSNAKGWQNPGKVAGKYGMPGLKVKKKPVNVSNTQIKPSTTKIDYGAAIADVLLAGPEARQGRGLLDVILEATDSGAYTTVTPESRTTTTKRIGTEKKYSLKGEGKYALPKGKGGKVHGGGSYDNTERIGEGARKLATQMGVPISGKRSYDTVEGPGVSDHYTGSTHAYANDLDISTDAQGNRLAKRIARFYGIPLSYIGTFNRFTITAAGGDRYSLQLLWHVKDHYDHVHFGVQAL